MTFLYLRRKLGISEIAKNLENMPVLNERYLQLLAPIEAVMSALKEPEGDDTLVMHHLRSMGYFGGHKIREEYLKGHKHAIASIRCTNCGSNSLETTRPDGSAP